MIASVSCTGNLGAHLRKLEDSGYLSLRREFVARKPVSWYSLSTAGRAALGKHMDVLSGLIASLKPSK